MLQPRRRHRKFETLVTVTIMNVIALRSCILQHISRQNNAGLNEDNLYGCLINNKSGCIIVKADLL